MVRVLLTTVSFLVLLWSIGIWILVDRYLHPVGGQTAASTLGKTTKTIIDTNGAIEFSATKFAVANTNFQIASRITTCTTAMYQNEENKQKEGCNVQYKLIDENYFGKNTFYKKYAGYRSNDQKITVREWAECMAQSDSSQSSLSSNIFSDLYSILKDIPYDAYFFETPSVTCDTYNTQPFEFVIVNAPSLHRFATNNPDYDAFESTCSKINLTNEQHQLYGCILPNLGGDAILVVPKPLIANNASDNKNFSHLAMFVRSAPYEQVKTIWEMVGLTYLEQIQVHKNKPVWFSTSGMGIAWLHFRFDEYPKYYTYLPYKSSKFVR